MFQRPYKLLMKSLIVSIALTLSQGLAVQGLSAQDALTPTLSAPLPDFDNPRKIMLQLNSSDPQQVNNILYNAINLKKAYGPDNVEIAIIAFGPGMKALYKNDNAVRSRIESLMKYDINFVGCGNTMDTTSHKPDDLIKGVSYAPAAIQEIVERQLDGWIYISP